jgi:deoxyadenosine/deoxycytidine kinase
MYIAVSGNLGSGKSTLAKALGRAFACDVYPRRSYNKTYIDDLFREPKRWTTEAQISFMVHKHDAVREGLSSGRLFVLDRSFDEEVEVFAERFHDDGVIDTRGINLIRRLAGDLRLRIQPPDLIVFCDCSADVAQERIDGRPRDYQGAYPPDHLTKLDMRLRSWLRQLSIPVMMVDTVKTDYRDNANAIKLAQKIDRALAKRTSSQGDLFDEAGGDDLVLPRRSLLRKRQVYLAAPFTAHAKPREVAREDYLFAGDGALEGIPQAYRRRLAGLARAIEAHGHEVLLPHRDINRWGKRSLPASEVAKRCLDAVADADCFVGMIAESFGSHAELGYALALRKPTLILLSARNTTSFFGQGMAAHSGASVLSASSVTAMMEKLRETDPLSLMKWSDQ